MEQPGRSLLVCNTHLYFHPESDNIRLVQFSICLNYIEDVLKQMATKFPSHKISPLFCGDFNSCPEFGVYQLATTGHVDALSEDWRSNKEEVANADLEVSHDLKLASACGLPVYTNYVGGFNGTLDYIFYDTTNLTVTEVVPYPSHEEVTLHTALPSVTFPSDHIASIATLKWKE